MPLHPGCWASAALPAGPWLHRAGAPKAEGRNHAMSKRGHWWWGAIQAALRLYPELRQRYGTPDNRLTAQYTAQPSCGGAGRPVEQLAMERLSDGDCAIYMAISDAVRETARMGRATQGWQSSTWYTGGGRGRCKAQRWMWGIAMTGRGNSIKSSSDWSHSTWAICPGMRCAKGSGRKSSLHRAQNL